MDRTFHSKVDWWYWLLMAVTAFLLFDFFWFHYTIATLLVAAVMIFEIEMLKNNTFNENLENNSFTIQYSGKEKYSNNNYLSLDKMDDNCYGYIITVDNDDTFKVRGIINGSRQ